MVLNEAVCVTQSDGTGTGSVLPSQGTVARAPEQCYGTVVWCVGQPGLWRALNGRDVAVHHDMRLFLNFVVFCCV